MKNERKLILFWLFLSLVPYCAILSLYCVILSLPSWLSLWKALKKTNNDHLKCLLLLSFPRPPATVWTWRNRHWTTTSGRRDRPGRNSSLKDPTLWIRRLPLHHTHTHARTRTRMLAHPHNHPPTHPPTHTHTHTSTHTCNKYTTHTHAVNTQHAHNTHAVHNTTQHNTHTQTNKHMYTPS